MNVSDVSAAWFNDAEITIPRNTVTPKTSARFDFLSLITRPPAAETHGTVARPMGPGRGPAPSASTRCCYRSLCMECHGRQVVRVAVEGRRLRRVHPDPLGVLHLEQVEAPARVLAADVGRAGHPAGREVVERGCGL